MCVYKHCHVGSFWQTLTAKICKYFNISNHLIENKYPVVEKRQLELQLFRIFELGISDDTFFLSYSTASDL